MNRQKWIKVMRLYEKRVAAGQYLWDVRPWNLRPTEFERLIVDSFYVATAMTYRFNKEDVRYLSKAYAGLPKPLIKTIEKHLR